MKEKETKTPYPVATTGMNCIPHSGGEGQQFHGHGNFDAKDRIVAKENGGTRTADILQRPGRHVPTEKMSIATSHDRFQPVDKSAASDWKATKKWNKSGRYDMVVPTKLKGE